MDAQLERFTASSGGWLLCTRKDGAGARLANLLWTWRLSRGAGLRTMCFWQALPAYYADASSLDDILDLGALESGGLQAELRLVDHPEKFARPSFVTLHKTGAHDPGEHAVSEADLAGLGSAHLPVIDTADGPLLREGETKAEATSQARALFARLPLHSTIRDAVDAAARTHELSRMVAVHVRSGDIVEGLREACLGFGSDGFEDGYELERCTRHYFRGCAPKQSYMHAARGFVGQGYGLLFFSDTPSTARPFQRRFGSNLLLAADLAPPGLSSLQQAVFEILLMSRCQAIVGTRSMFSTLASVIGGARVLDVRLQATPSDTIKAFRRAAGFDALPPDVRAEVSEVALRKLEQGRFLRRWKADAGEIRRLLEGAG